MYEKVNPKHPDKIADRIAGAIVDAAYELEDSARMATEILIGHGNVFVITESSVWLTANDIRNIVERIAGKQNIRYINVPQDEILSENQENGLRCGDNGIFMGVPKTTEEKELSRIAHKIYNKYRSDGKYIIDGEKLIICQSNASKASLKEQYPNAIINPLGDWEGGLNVDTGAVNRKLGSDMGSAVTGGGLHGKDLSKADVSVNIWLHQKAEEEQKIQMCSCAIGDAEINGISYASIVKSAKEYIEYCGGFEKFAEWGF